MSCFWAWTFFLITEEMASQRKLSIVTQNGKEEEKKVNGRITNLLLFAVATSVDVLVTGLLFVPYPGWLFPSVLTIGAITALFSLGGYLLGVFVGKLKINMELVGGLVLIGLGIKICLEGCW